MGIRVAVRNGLQAFQAGLRDVPVVYNPVPVVDAPQKEIPPEWEQALFGPGRPPVGMFGGLRMQEAEAEKGWTTPRTFSYNPNVNLTITPRTGYGLTPFSSLKYYAETIPEVATCRRMIIEELKSFVPVIHAPDGKVVQKARVYLRERRLPSGRLEKAYVHTGTNGTEIEELAWMTTKPDRRTTWATWLSRFMYSSDVYDAGCLYRMRDESGALMGLRVIDGSTMFVIIDQHGDIPALPAPSFMQVILGTPRGSFTDAQVWYRPRQLRPDAPYGISAIEDAMTSIKFLENWWAWERAKYTDGANPGRTYTAPPGWKPEQIFAYMETINARFGGNIPENQAIFALPDGFALIANRDQGRADNLEDHDKATKNVQRAWGITASEVGDAPGEGLGGKGYQEAGATSFFRQGIAPRLAYIEAPFNEMLEELGFPGYTMELAFPSESIDPDEEKDFWVNLWEKGGATRDQLLEGVGKKAVGGAAGAEYYKGAAPAAPGMEGGMAAHLAPPAGAEKSVTATPAPTFAKAQDSRRVRIAKALPVAPEDDAYYGAPVLLQSEYPGYNATLAPLGQEPRPAVWTPHAYPVSEARYLLDRSMELYEVPVTYLADVGGTLGTVGLRSSGYTSTAGKRCLDYLLGLSPQCPAGLADHLTTLDGDAATWADLMEVLGQAATLEIQERVKLALGGGNGSAAE